MSSFAQDLYVCSPIGYLIIRFCPCGLAVINFIVGLELDTVSLILLLKLFQLWALGPLQAGCWGSDQARHWAGWGWVLTGLWQEGAGCREQWGADPRS